VFSARFLIPQSIFRLITKLTASAGSTMSRAQDRVYAYLSRTSSRVVPSCPARKHDWAGDLRFVRASGGVRVFVDQAVEDGFSADPLDIEVGHGGPGSVASGAGDALGDALVRPGGVVVGLVLG
jgi:hypothetical protein